MTSRDRFGRARCKGVPLRFLSHCEDSYGVARAMGYAQVTPEKRLQLQDARGDPTVAASQL